MADGAAAYPSFDEAHYRARHDQLRGWMAEQGLDALIVYGLGSGQNTNVEWIVRRAISNMTVFFPLVGDPIGFVQPKATVPFAARMSLIEVRNGGVDYSEVLIDQIASRGLEHGRIGLIEIDTLRTRGIPHTLYLALASRFPDVTWSEAGEGFEFLRWPLNSAELAWVDRAAADLDQVMDVFTAALRPGTSPSAAVEAAQLHAREHGLALSALSARAAAMDGSTSIMDPEGITRPLRAGDYVFFESNARYGPYVAYRGFPVTLGEPFGQARLLFDTADEIGNEAARRLTPGGHSRDIIALGDIVEQRGLSTHGPLTMGNGTGGWQLICERRFEGGYRPVRDVVFAPGMVFSAAPHLCTADWSMITIIGNTVIVTPDGPRIAGQQGIGYRVVEA